MTAPLPPLTTYLEMSCEDNDQLETAIKAYAKLAVREELERAASRAEVFMHIVPDEGGDELDRIGRYSNATVRRVAASIRAMIEELDK